MTRNKTETKPKIFVALGASITYGYPFEPEDSWVERVRLESGWKVINAGIPGDTFRDLNLRLAKDVLDHDPDIVCLMAGTNDVNQGLSQPVIQQEVRNLLLQLQQKNIEVIIGLPLPVKTSREKSLSILREWLREFGESQNLPVIDFHKDFIDEAGRIRSELLIDGCHPRREGYAIMGQRAVITLKEKGII